MNKASFIAQLVNHLPVIQETGSIPGLGKSLGKEMATHFSIFTSGESQGQMSLVGYSHRISRVGHALVTKLPPSIWNNAESLRWTLEMSTIL